ncbi:MAG: hypothetical protein ACI4JJ_03910 [Huintestinicola sp.]
MTDTYLYEIIKKREKYISENKNQAAQCLKKYYGSNIYSNSQFEIYNPVLPLRFSIEELEQKINYMNKAFNVSWHISDTYIEMQKLKNTNDNFMIFVADFCLVIANHILKGQKLNYSEALFYEIRFTQFALLDMQTIYNVQVTLRIVEMFWIAYSKYMDMEGFEMYG